MRAAKSTEEAATEKKLELEIENVSREIKAIDDQINLLKKDRRALEEQFRKQKMTQLQVEQQKKILWDLKTSSQRKLECFSKISSFQIQLDKMRNPEQFEPAASAASQSQPENKSDSDGGKSETFIEEIMQLVTTPTEKSQPVVAAAAVVSETQQSDANSSATEIKITVVAADADAVTPSFQTPRSPTSEVSPGISDAKQPYVQPVETREPYDATNASEIIPAIHKTAPLSRDQMKELLKKLPHATVPISETPTAPISETPITDDSPVSKKFWDVSKKIETGSFLFFIAAGTTFSMIEKWGSAQGKHLDVISSFAQNNPTMTLFGSGLISAVALSQLWRAMFSLCHDFQNKSMITSSETTSESEKRNMESHLIKVTVFITCMVCLLVPLQFYLDHKASTISNTIGNTIKNASASYFLLIQPMLALNFSLLAKLGYAMGRYALSKCRATSLSPDSPVEQRHDSLSSTVVIEKKPLLHSPS